LWYFDLQIPEVGNEQDRVFHVLDQQGSDHSGPLLMFKPREHAERTCAMLLWSELASVSEILIKVQRICWSRPYAIGQTVLVEPDR
jgi:hypothetical protein